MDKEGLGEKVIIDFLKVITVIVSTLSGFMFMFALRRCAQNNYDIGTRFLIPIWGQYTDTFAVVTACIFFWIAFAFVREYAVIWLMFYDSTFELMSVPFAYMNWVSLFIFGLTVALMLIVRIKIQFKWQLFSCYLLIIILAASQKNWSEFMTQGLWLSLIGITQFVKVKKENVSVYAS